MGWATNRIARLRAGEIVTFRPRGHSMTGIVDDGEACTVEPVADPASIARGDVVLCTVRGRQFLHLVKAVDADGRCQIGNNRGGINGWTPAAGIHGRLVRKGG